MSAASLRSRRRVGLLGVALLAAAAALAGGCTGGPFGRTPAPADFILERKVERAEGLLAGGELEDARRIFYELAETYEPHRYTRVSQVRLAEIDLAAGRTEAAHARLEEVVAERQADAADERARLLLGRALLAQGRDAEAEPLLDAYLRAHPDARDAAEIGERLGDVAARRGARRLALERYDAALAKTTAPERVARLRSRIDEVTLAATREELEPLARAGRGSYVAQRALARLGTLATEERTRQDLTERTRRQREADERRAAEEERARAAAAAAAAATVPPPLEQAAPEPEPLLVEPELPLSAEGSPPAGDPAPLPPAGPTDDLATPPAGPDELPPAGESVAIALPPPPYAERPADWEARLAERARAAAQIEAELQQRGRGQPAGGVDARAVGCLLTLSGPYASFGRLALDGLMQAAGVYSGPEVGEWGSGALRWIVRDDAGDPARGAALVDELVDVHRVVAIVGPLVGAVAEAAAARANERGVPLLTLTRKTPLQGIGRFVYRTSVTDPALTRGLAHFAREELGIRRFAVLYPAEESGVEARDLFIQAVQADGGEVVAQSSFSPKATDFGDAIKALLAARASVVRKVGDELRTGFEGLFVPASVPTLALLGPQLAFYDLQGIQLLGTSAWNSPRTVAAAGPHLQGAVFLDGFLAASADPRAHAFTQRFTVAHAREPTVVEALAYEAGALVREVLADGTRRERVDFARALLALDGYRGVAGLTGFEPSGEARRELSVLTIAGDRIVALPWPAGYSLTDAAGARP